MPIGTTRLRRSDQLRADGWVLVRLTPPGDARVQNQAVRPAGRIPEQSWPLRQAFGVQGYVRGPCPNLACGRKGLVLMDGPAPGRPYVYYYYYYYLHTHV